jgi:hypothetical protein
MSELHNIILYKKIKTIVEQSPDILNLCILHITNLRKYCNSFQIQSECKNDSSYPVILR